MHQIRFGMEYPASGIIVPEAQKTRVREARLFKMRQDVVV